MGKSLLCSTSEVVKLGLRCLRPFISPNSSRSSLYIVLSPCTHRSATPIFPPDNSRNYSCSIMPHLVVLCFAPVSSSASIGISLAGQSSTSIPQKASSLGTDYGTHKCTILMVQLVVARIPLARNKIGFPVQLYSLTSSYLRPSPSIKTRTKIAIISGERCTLGGKYS
ncbi:hypothetical protein JG687_00018323 [Phytophthora cactorum]|uniref:Uncharacterized protein n=1 Tax=Phytophthora cactorum TaxID=29920 RepID=A0A8T1TQX2_9STRA|nr:hypothetical protein JG687_00018323 [Phytophthora cactorum]